MAAEAINRLGGVSILDGLAIEGIELQATGETVVQHKLGRMPNGWLVIGHDFVNAAAARTPIETSRTATHLGLTCLGVTAGDKLDLWVF